MFDTVSITFLDTGELEVWHGKLDSIKRYAEEQKRPLLLRTANEEEKPMALPFFWGHKIPRKAYSGQGR